MSVTIKEIAEIAGVHRSTVDKVLHNREGVSDEVRERVKNIIHELGYEPNIIGKALSYQKKTLLVPVLLLDFDTLEEMKAGIEEAYREYKQFGLKIQYYITSNSDPVEQLNIINHLKKKKISGLIITPLNDIRIRNAIDEIVDEGIPVITTNIDLPESKRMCFVGQDMLKAGRVAGELMGEILNGHGKVAIITDSKIQSFVQKRQEGFEKVIKNTYPNIEIVDVVETYEQKLTTFQKTKSLLDKIEDLKGIYITCGNVSEVGKVVRFMNKDKQVKIVSFDVYPEIVQLIKEDVINFTIAQDLFSQGYKPLKILFDYLYHEKKPETEHIKTSIDIKIKGNIE
ncbi:LacI family DNA-binding transcriptional regulator [Fodinisporobacter ferrooxydans]|uniref:LacI family DNA-binding transcriptional regulator n=1 Tax=Fodinisporobacter ferrooxydans TaxID=2901836 RepID=A0ABY4CKA8_9BACL|nr:LacI family DNA-binding transcriptional regulator [Alicyclobacillaceae bacterium MYW30-H2]